MEKLILCSTIEGERQLCTVVRRSTPEGYGEAVQYFVYRQNDDTSHNVDANPEKQRPTTAATCSWMCLCYVHDNIEPNEEDTPTNKHEQTHPCQSPYLFWYQQL